MILDATKLFYAVPLGLAALFSGSIVAIGLSMVLLRLCVVSQEEYDDTD